MTPQDVKTIGPDILRHRLLISYEAEARDLTSDDLTRVAELELKYADLDLGMVDASVIATCERLGEAKVATLDRRHFGTVRPRHCTSLRLLPD